MRRPPPTVGASSEQELTIESIAAGGDGVARANGLVVFTPRTAPGDTARVKVTPQGRFARGLLLDVIEPSVERTEPPCEHYVRDRCGGCQLQHLSYDAQLFAKGIIVRDALRRIGGAAVDEVPDVAPSTHEWRYRRKLTLTLRQRGGEWIAGLHRYDNPAYIFRLKDCPITDDRVITVWSDVLAASKFLPPLPELRGAVRLLGDGHEASFVLEGGTRWPQSEKFWAAMPSLASLWWRPERGAIRRLRVRTEEAELGASFAQINVAVGSALHDHVVARVARYQPVSLVDAYAGAGETAVRIAKTGVRVTAIEYDRQASEWCAARLPHGSRAITARVEDAIADALPTDVVLLNPPRTGLDAAVPPALLDSGARAIIYVSCNPATLARDVARLPGWRIAALQSFDMFPQTAHVETVCELVPETP